MKRDKNHSTLEKDWSKQLEGSTAYFIGSFPELEQQHLDFSTASLDLVEKWLLDRYEEPAAVYYEEDTQLFEGGKLYIGETYRRNLNGRWAQYANEPNFPFPNTPVIEGYIDDDDEVLEPWELVRETLNYRYGDGLKVGLEGFIKLFLSKGTHNAS